MQEVSAPEHAKFVACVFNCTAIIIAINMITLAIMAQYDRLIVSISSSSSDLTNIVIIIISFDISCSTISGVVDSCGTVTSAADSCSTSSSVADSTTKRLLVAKASFW